MNEERKQAKEDEVWRDLKKPKALGNEKKVEENKFVNDFDVFHGTAGSKAKDEKKKPRTVNFFSNDSDYSSEEYDDDVQD